MIRALLENPLLQDPRNFLAAAWAHLHLPPPTPVQYEIVQWMASGPDRQCTKGFRGVGKSWICSVFCAYLWAMDADTKIMVVSGSARRAGDFTTFVRQLLETWDLLEDLRPGPLALRDSKLSFDVAGTRLAHAPSMTSLGVGGQLTGNRADVIIGDDVETESNSDTPTKREKLAAHVQEFASILSPGGKIILLGTDQSEESLYRAAAGKGYRVRVWPVRFPAADLCEALGETLAPSLRDAVETNPGIAGRPTDPLRFPEEECLVREAELGRSRFNLQFMLDPRLSDTDRYPLRLSDLIVMPLDPERAPEKVVYGTRVVCDIPCLGFGGDRYWTPVSVSERWLPYQGIVLFLDPAGRGKDEPAVAVVGQLNGYLFLLELKAWTGEGYSDEVLAAIATLAAKYKVARVVVEANFGDGMVTRLLEPHLHRSGHHCALEEVKHSIQKEKRIIDTLEPVLQQHRLAVDPRVLLEDLRPIAGVPEAGQLPYRLAHQLSRITRDRGSLHHDDRLDALAGAVAFWRESVAQDADRRSKEQTARLMDQEIERFHRFALNPFAGPTARKRGWLERSVGRPAAAGRRPPPQRPTGQGRPPTRT